MFEALKILGVCQFRNSNIIHLTYSLFIWIFFLIWILKKMFPSIFSEKPELRTTDLHFSEHEEIEFCNLT